MKIAFTLSQLGPGKNAILTTRSGRRYPSKQYEAWEKEALVEMMAAGITRLSYTEKSVFMDVAYSPRDKGRHDVDNIISPLLHLLVTFGILKDDAQVTQLFFHTVRDQAYALKVCVGDY